MGGNRLRVLVEIALTVALCGALYAVFHVWMPWNFAGGEIALTMVPIMVLALRRGVLPAMIAGATWGVLQALLEPQFVYYPAQALLDYPLAFAFVGLAGLGSNSYRMALSRAQARAAVTGALWLLLGVGARFAAHTLSGIVFFAENVPPGQPVLVYSLLYNAAYIVPSALLCAGVTLLVVPTLERAVPVSVRSTPA